MNMYGPTEATIWSSAWEVNELTTGVPIGGALSNSIIHLLDDNNNPVLPGIPGEIVIGGEGVVRGYLNKPKSSEEKFIVDFLNPNSDKKLYKTGDIAFVNEDGVLEFIGRRDQRALEFAAGRGAGRKVKVEDVYDAFSVDGGGVVGRIPRKLAAAAE